MLSATSNGHVGGSSRNNRRSVDKDKHRNKAADTAADNEHNNGTTRHAGSKNNNSNSNTSNSSNSNSYQQADGNANTTTSNNSKEKSDCDSGNSNYQQQQQQHGAKDKHGKWNEGCESAP